MKQSNEQFKNRLIKKYNLDKKEIEVLIEGVKRDLTKDEKAITEHLFASYSWNYFKPVKGFLLPKISKNSYIDFAFVDVEPKMIIINLGK